MFEKFMFICIINKKKITQFTIAATFLILALTTWPFYLNRHLNLGILTLLYSIQIFNEWLKHRKRDEHGLYFLTAGLLFMLAGFQFVEYFY